MKKVLVVGLLAMLASVVPLHAQTSQLDSEYKSAKVVSLKTHMMPADFIGGVINDEIPQPQKYVYDVAIRVDCNVHVGRYESSTNQMPSIFELNRIVNIRLNGALMILDSPRGGQPVTTAILSDEGASRCPEND